MGILACLYPFGNFIELTPFNLVVLALYQISLYLGGSFFMQKKIKAEKLMKEAEESNYNKRELDSLGSTEIKSEESKKKIFMFFFSVQWMEGEVQFFNY